MSRASLRPGATRHIWLIRAAALCTGAAFAFVLACGMTKDLYERLDSAAMAESPRHAVERVGSVARQVRADWDLESWTARSDRPDLISLAMYINACTAPSDRILSSDLHASGACARATRFRWRTRRSWPGFFATEEAQRLTLERLQRQSVPFVLLETGESYQNFRESFPLVTAYIDEQYRLAGTRVFDGRFGISLFVRRSMTSSSIWAPLDWPCYGSGRIMSS